MYVSSAATHLMLTLAALLLPSSNLLVFATLRREPIDARAHVSYQCVVCAKLFIKPCHRAEVHGNPAAYFYVSWQRTVVPLVLN